jgi:Glycosyl transferase family 2
MDDPLWTICIATLAGRREKLSRLLAHLLPQCEADGRVEVIACHDNGDMPLPAKRQALLEAAQGAYVSYVDDDDTVDPRFVQLVTAAMEHDPDYVAFRHVYYVAGVRQPQQVTTGLHLKTWFSTREVLARDITHVNPVKASIAKQADFTAPSEGAEDWAYTTTVRRLAVTQEVIGADLYHYFHDPADSAQHQLAPAVNYPRAEVASPCFRWIEVPHRD